MGNTFIDPQSTSFRNDNTLLGEYVKNFYKNNYKFLNDDSLSDITKKRACCMNNNPVPISLPSFNTTTKKVVPTVLPIKIFTDAEYNNPATCTFSGYSYKNRVDADNKTASNLQCDNFYTNYCRDTLYQKRKQTYPKPAGDVDDLHRYYGPYDLTEQNKSTNPFLTLNANSDCNCITSKYQDPAGAYTIGTKGDAALDANSSAQNFDKQCYGPTTGGKNLGNPSYISTHLKSGAICQNIVEVGGNISATRNSNIDINLSCPNLAAVQPSDPARPPVGTPTTTPTATPAATQAATQAATPTGTQATQAATVGATPAATVGATVGATQAATQAATTRPILAATTGPTAAVTAAPAVESEIIKGLSNQTFYIILGVGGGVLILLILMMMMMRGGRGGRRRRSYDDY